jgi:hypothetical protein
MYATGPVDVFIGGTWVGTMAGMGAAFVTDPAPAPPSYKEILRERREQMEANDFARRITQALRRRIRAKP